MVHYLLYSQTPCGKTMATWEVNEAWSHDWSAVTCKECLVKWIEYRLHG